MDIFNDFTISQYPTHSFPFNNYGQTLHIQTYSVIIHLDLIYRTITVATSSPSRSFPSLSLLGWGYFWTFFVDRSRAPHSLLLRPLPFLEVMMMPLYCTRPIAYINVLHMVPIMTHSCLRNRFDCVVQVQSCGFVLDSILVFEELGVGSLIEIDEHVHVRDAGNGGRVGFVECDKSSGTLVPEKSLVTRKNVQGTILQSVELVLEY